MGGNFRKIQKIARRALALLLPGGLGLYIWFAVFALPPEQGDDWEGLFVNTTDPHRIIRLQEKVQKADELAIKGAQLRRDGAAFRASGSFFRALWHLPSRTVTRPRVKAYRRQFTDSLKEILD
ncbi:MAG: hypothetical protein HKN23_12780 [Verrucomicrobiales bacterium]|nr:hypothetical protein [Verrucomicrobiales bacterium]